MKYLTRYFLGLILVIFISSSCQNELNKVPLDAPSNTTFFTNEKELQLAINGAYGGLWWGGDPMPLLIDNATDLGLIRNTVGGDLHSVGVGSGTSETPVFRTTWDHMYSAISRCNNLLENMSRARDKVSEELYTQIQAQAKFLRAFYYFWLVELYGNVPLITKIPTIKDAEKMAQSPKDSVIAQMFKDLDFAAQNLPVSWPGSDEGRATKGAAFTLKARTALLNGMYDIAAKAAKKVMDMGVYALYPNYEDLFQYEGEHNIGVILDEPFKIGVRTANTPVHEGTRNIGGYSVVIPSQFMVDMYACVDGKPIDESSLYDPAHPFENRDPRLDASIIRPGSIFGGYIYYTHPDSTMTTYIQNGQKKRVENHDVTNANASPTGYCWRKYNDPEDFPERRASSELNFIYMRYAEVLLTYAEAKIEMGEIDQSVLDAINKVRARAYGVDISQTDKYPAVTTMDQNKLRQKVRYERTIEFADEGFRLFDLRRWEIGKEVMDGIFFGRPKSGYTTITQAPDIDENGHPHYGSMKDLYRHVETRSFDPNRDYLWAIPQKDLDIDPNLEQNPGY